MTNRNMRTKVKPTFDNVSSLEIHTLQGKTGPETVRRVLDVIAYSDGGCIEYIPASQCGQSPNPTPGPKPI